MIRKRSISLVSLLVSVSTVALLVGACGDDDNAPAGTKDGGSDADSSTPPVDGGNDATTPVDASEAGDASDGGTGDGGDGGAGCFGGGTAATPTGAGTCASPYVIDLSASALGTIVSYTASGGADEANFLAGGACGVTFSGTARDVVFHVKMPSGVASLDVSVDAAAGANPRIGVAEDPSCGQPLNACASIGGDGACEYVNAPKGGAGFFGTETYVVVSEPNASGQPLTVRFRAK